MEILNLMRSSDSDPGEDPEEPHSTGGIMLLPERRRFKQFNRRVSDPSALAATASLFNPIHSFRRPPLQEVPSFEHLNWLAALCSDAITTPAGADQRSSGHKTVASRPSTPIRVPSQEEEDVCPFCRNGRHIEEEQQELAPMGKTRRTTRTMKRKRSACRVGKWWRKYGYNGPTYCQRCSEIFRDHIIRKVSNSAKCVRESPCVDCTKVLAFLPRPLDAVFKTMDTGQSISKANSDRRAKKHKTASVVDMSALVL